MLASPSPGGFAAKTFTSNGVVIKECTLETDLASCQYSIMAVHYRDMISLPLPFSRIQTLKESRIIVQFI